MNWLGRSLAPLKLKGCLPAKSTERSAKTRAIDGNQPNSSLLCVTVNLSEAKAHSGQYVAKANAGEVITICERNKPVAELHAPRLSFTARKLKLGALKGKFQVPDDFNAPLTDFESEFYGSPRAKPGRLR